MLMQGMGNFLATARGASSIAIACAICGEMVGAVALKAGVVGARLAHTLCRGVVGVGATAPTTIATVWVGGAAASTATTATSVCPAAPATSVVVGRAMWVLLETHTTVIEM